MTDLMQESTSVAQSIDDRVRDVLIERSGQALDDALARHKKNLEDEVKIKTKALDIALEAIKTKDKSIAGLQSERKALDHDLETLRLERKRLVAFCIQQRDSMSAEISDLVPRISSAPLSTAGCSAEERIAID